MLKMRYSQTVAKYGNTGTIGDRKRAFYKGLGYSGTLRDMEMAWLTIAASGAPGTLTDKWTRFLGGAGTLTDKVIKWAGK